MNRRGFFKTLGVILAAPAIVRADSLMRVVPMDRGIITLDMIEAEVARDVVFTINTVAKGGGNTLMTTSMITNEMLTIMQNELILAQRVDEAYDGRFVRRDTIRRDAARWTVDGKIAIIDDRRRYRG